MCPLRVGDWVGDDAGDGEQSSKGDLDHIKEELNGEALVEDAELSGLYIGARARAHIRGYSSTSPLT
jgi:hypothetical protein